MHDAADGAIKWGYGGNGAQYAIPDVPTTGSKYNAENCPYTGYNYTKSIVEWGTNGHDYTAAKAVTDYRMSEDDDGPKAPLKSSGWYLPSIEQLIDIEKITNRVELFEFAQGEDLISNDYNGRYWSCIVGSNANVWTYRFDGKKTIVSAQKKPSNSQFKTHASYVRAVLTF